MGSQKPKFSKPNPSKTKLTTAQRALRARWATALSSRKYRQGRMLLRSRDNYYCPFGVLCDIINPKGWVKGDNYGPYGFHWKSIIGFPPRTVMKAVGLTDIDVENINTLNDYRKKPFKEIAKRIRSGDFEPFEELDENAWCLSFEPTDEEE
jgi:hypothetical protein